MKKSFILLIVFFLLFVLAQGRGNCQGVTDKEIIERLTRIEEGQKAILREMDKRFEGVDKRFEGVDKRFEMIEKRFDQMINLFIAIVGAFSAIVAVTIGFAIWDRRTMIRPFETKVKSIEEEIVSNKKILHSLIEALKALSKTDEKVVEILKKFNIL